jgi:hypothetical protein
MDRDKIINELERFIQFSKDTEMNPNKGYDFSAAGHKIDVFLSYPKDAPGISLYWDSDVENLMTAKLLLEYFKDNVDIQKDAFPRLTHLPNYIKIKINTMNYILLNPQFENLIVGESNRGLEVLLLLWLNPNWKKIYCYDERGVYGTLIKEYFKDDRITWNKQVTCEYDFSLLQEDNYLFVLNHSLGWGSKHWVTCPKVKMIIKDGIVVDQNKHWKSHMPQERIDKVFEELQIEVEKKYGKNIFEYKLEE